MKQVVIVIILGTLLLSCRKEHSCVCTVTTVTSQVITPQNGDAPVQSTNTTIDRQTTTYSKVRKRDVNQLMDCSSRNSVSGLTYQVTLDDNSKADVSRQSTVSYRCEVR